MTSYSIQFGTQGDSAVGDLLDVSGGSTFQTFDSSQWASSKGAVLIKAVHASMYLNHSNFGVVESAGSCVSDSSYTGSAEHMSTVLPDLHMEYAVNTDAMYEANDHGSLSDLAQSLLNSLPDVGKGLSGELSAAELSTLINSLQSQLLELNEASNNLFGNMSDDVGLAGDQVASVSVDDLLSSAQVDASTLSDYGFNSLEHHSGLSSDTTLDALFTNPEAFPLTLDFSDSSSVDQSAELFASHGGSSISSSAIDSDAGFDPSFGGGSGFENS